MLLPRLQGNKHAITSNLSLHYRDVRMVDSLVNTACHDQPGPFLPDTCISRIRAGCKLHQGATCSQIMQQMGAQHERPGVSQPSGRRLALHECHGLISSSLLIEPS